jgi:hypothetical protein
MKPGFFLTALLLAASLPARADIITLACTGEGDPQEHSVVLDTAQQVVLQDGRPGNIGLVTDQAIHYFLKVKGVAQANRYNRADDSLILAISKPAPDTGYERRQWACRRK